MKKFKVGDRVKYTHLKTKETLYGVVIKVTEQGGVRIINSLDSFGRISRGAFRPKNMLDNVEKV